MTDATKTVSATVEKVMDDGSCLFVLPDGTKITAVPGSGQSTDMNRILPGDRVRIELSPPSKAEKGYKPKYRLL